MRFPRRRIRPAIRTFGRGRSTFGSCWPRGSGRRPRRLRTGGGAASESCDNPVDLPGVQLLLGPFHPCLPFAFVRSHGLHCGGRIFEGMELVEDLGRVPSRQDFLAGRRQPSMRRIKQAGHAKAIEPTPGIGRGKTRVAQGRPRTKLQHHRHVIGRCGKAN